MILRDKLITLSLIISTLSISFVVVIIQNNMKDSRVDIFYKEPVVGKDETFELESMSLTSVTNMSGVQHSPEIPNRNISLQDIGEASDVSSRAKSNQLSALNYFLGMVMFVCIAIISVLTVLGLLSLIN